MTASFNFRVALEGKTGKTKTLPKFHKDGCKGQKISKADLLVLNSSKKRMKNGKKMSCELSKYIFFCFLIVFLEELRIIKIVYETYWPLTEPKNPLKNLKKGKENITWYEITYY